MKVLLTSCRVFEGCLPMERNVIKMRNELYVYKQDLNEEGYYSCKSNAIWLETYDDKEIPDVYKFC